MDGKVRREIVNTFQTEKDRKLGEKMPSKTLELTHLFLTEHSSKS